ncbi:hypothetical protein [Asanoa siamensis]|uniref:Uncharacterized protein n=1 Tax=Asanoa siamensis TaxID=926357 RepID=A0ABQ4CVR6_9ACTN|nr:hypothetical protein [Asanoa siamensis]GIF75113.1 hypothetical protein Asi02nite_46310 [Asanoa siamensis]
MTWQEAVMGATGVLFAGAIVVVVIVQAAATWRARMSVTREEAYRTLVEQATAAQEETARQLAAVHAELATVRDRTTALERMLKEVGEPWEAR